MKFSEKIESIITKCAHEIVSYINEQNELDAILAAAVPVEKARKRKKRVTREQISNIETDLKLKCYTRAYLAKRYGVNRWAIDRIAQLMKERQDGGGDEPQ